tara:strand:+ start:356 stop:796 length:441 start_codon:yes stop_codon:yes gene_type:complete
MNDFNKMVLTIAIIVFIITLVVVGIILYYSVRNSSFPPYDTLCPTYYTVSGDLCVWNEYLYTDASNSNYPNSARPSSVDGCSSVSIDTFNQQGFDKDEKLCAKNRWAKNCGVFWDGVTNNTNACFRANSSLFPGNYGSTNYGNTSS